MVSIILFGYVFLYRTTSLTSLSISQWPCSTIARAKSILSVQELSNVNSLGVFGGLINVEGFCIKPDCGGRRVLDGGETSLTNGFCK